MQIKQRIIKEPESIAENSIYSGVSKSSIFGWNFFFGSFYKRENKQGTCSDKNKEIDNIGTIHISFGVDNMENVKKKICDLQGEIKTQTYILNGNKCCFAKDPEGNWLELISKSDK